MMQTSMANVKSLDSEGAKYPDRRGQGRLGGLQSACLDFRRPQRLKTQHFERHIVARLVRALDWFDNGLQSILRQRGYRPVHRTQSMIIVHIASGIDRPADIAREMGLTRQNIHHMAKPLIDEGLIEQRAVPTDSRSTFYAFTEQSEDIRAAAREALSYLERVLVRRIGREPVKQLKSVLAMDWGEEVTEMPKPPRHRKR
jgi:DNA-binding MarR family transcriptional regulator